MGFARKIVGVALAASLVLPSTTWSQTLPGESQTVASGPRRQIATIIFSGLAGAILGLSTLSFYGRPQEKLSNIAVGFAIGIIVGTSYTTYRAATEPYEYLSLDSPLHDPAAALLEARAPVWGLRHEWNF
jgi:hypothetical protein